MVLTIIIKVLDPACGSGAFPMGILQKMLLILQKVDHDAQNSIHQILSDIQDPVYRKLIESKLKAAQVYDDNDLDDYARKLNIIRRSIYGVDIQPVAIDIAKLRFFLSIIVDEVVQDELPNRGIEPLPNLEFKFVCANTLIPLPPDRQLFENIDAIEKLEQLRDKFFISYGNEKRDIKKEFTALQANMFNESISLFNREKVKQASTQQTQTQMLATWNPFSNETTSWFDPKWMFGENNGFDVVIGNPPWGSDLTKEQKEYFKNLYPEIDSSTPNSFAYFLGVGHILNSCVLTYVLPDSILIKDYKKTRKLLLNGLKICNWYQNTSMPDKLKPFVYVAHDVAVIISTKKSFQAFISNLNEYSSDSNSVEIIRKSIDKKDVVTENFDFIYNLALEEKDFDVLKKINKFRMADSFLQCHEGIHTGNCRDILFHSSKINQHCKPLFYGGGAGDTINSYFSNRSGWWVDYRSQIIDKENGYYASLRDEKIFKYPKIYVSRTGNPFKAFYDENNYASNNFFSLQFINYDLNTEFNLKLVLAFINSNVSHYFIRRFAAPRLGDTFVETKIIHLLKFRIPSLEFKQAEIIVKMVNQIIIQKSNHFNTNFYEIKLNLIVYKLYELTYDEAMIVDPELEQVISREDYEKAGIEDLAEWEV